MSLFDLKDRMDLDRNKKLYWIATITLIPILSSGIYLLGGGANIRTGLKGPWFWEES